MSKLLKGGLVMIGLFAGCSQESTNAAPQPAELAKGKVAVVYFSWGGNTRFAAETIAKKASADIFEIKAETPYNSDFHKCCDEAKPECRGKTLRPIKPIEGLDLAKYDVVFGAARAHVGHAEQGRAQGQDGVSLPDAWRRRDGTRGQGVC